jgi:hypothetical protein
VDDFPAGTKTSGQTAKIPSGQKTWCRENFSVTEAAFAFSETLRDFSEHKHPFSHEGLPHTNHACRRRDDGFPPSILDRFSFGRLVAVSQHPDSLGLAYFRLSRWDEHRAKIILRWTFSAIGV